MQRRGHLLEIAHSKPGKVRTVTGDGRNRGGVYIAPTAAPMVEGVETEDKEGEVTTNLPGRGIYPEEGNILHQSPEACWIYT